MTTVKKMKMLLGATAYRYDRETGDLLERVIVRTMDDAWEICCSNLTVEKGQLVMYTATLKYVFANKRLSAIAKND